jgi:hypothetical protein
MYLKRRAKQSTHDLIGNGFRSKRRVTAGMCPQYGREATFCLPAVVNAITKTAKKIQHSAMVLRFPKSQKKALWERRKIYYPQRA